MTSALRRPRLITFDAFGTLFRAEEVASQDVMEAIIANNGLALTAEELGRRWWDLSYRVASDRFATVRESTRRALALLLEEAGSRDDPEPYTHQLLEGWTRTDPYPEVEDALDALEGFDLGIVSNVDDAVLESLLHRSGLADRFHVVVTSEACRAYKPDPALFRRALYRAACSPERALHLGDSPVDDVLGPKRVGMMAGWINRRDEKLRGRIPRPDLEARDLVEAAEEVLRA